MNLGAEAYKEVRKLAGCGALVGLLVGFFVGDFTGNLVGFAAAAAASAASRFFPTFGPVVCTIVGRLVWRIVGALVGFAVIAARAAASFFFESLGASAGTGSGAGAGSGAAAEAGAVAVELPPQTQQAVVAETPALAYLAALAHSLAVYDEQSYPRESYHSALSVHAASNGTAALAAPLHTQHACVASIPLVFAYATAVGHSAEV